MPTPREDRLERYRRLVLSELPARGRDEGWVVDQDHCFGRIVLDAAVGGGPWYDVLGRGRGHRGPAYARLSDEQLTRAVEVAERIAAEGDPLLRELDAASLAARGKPPKPAPGPGGASPAAPAGPPDREAAGRPRRCPRDGPDGSTDPSRRTRR